MRREIIILISLVIFTTQNQSICQNAVWQKTSLDSIHITSAVVNSVGDVLVGTHRSALEGSNYVLKTTDDGVQWHVLLSTSWIDAVALDNNNIYAGTASGVFYSRDNGTNWTYVRVVGTGFANIQTIAIDALGRIFAGASDGTPLSLNGLYRSLDNGITWTHLVDSVEVQSLCITSDGLIFRGDYGGGISRSTNVGDTWQKVGLVGKAVLSLASDKYGNIFAGTIDSGLFRSTDEGVNWSQSSLCNRQVYSIVIHSNGHVYVGTDAGVYDSKDVGVTWSQINDGLKDTLVNTLVFNLRSYIFAGTSSGVFRSIQPITSSIKGGDISENNLLGQNFPNPFNPTTSISFSLRTRSFVLLNVFDLMGREVAIVASEELSPGNYTRQWNAVNMSSGVYFYRLSAVPSVRRDLVPSGTRDAQAGSFIETKKLILIR